MFNRKEKEIIQEIKKRRIIPVQDEDGKKGIAVFSDPAFVRKAHIILRTIMIVVFVLIGIGSYLIGTFREPVQMSIILSIAAVVMYAIDHRQYNKMLKSCIIFHETGGVTFSLHSPTPIYSDIEPQNGKCVPVTSTSMRNAWKIGEGKNFIRIKHVKVSKSQFPNLDKISREYRNACGLIDCDENDEKQPE